MTKAPFSFPDFQRIKNNVTVLVTTCDKCLRIQKGSEKGRVGTTHCKHQVIVNCCSEASLTMISTQKSTVANNSDFLIVVISDVCPLLGKLDKPRAMSDTKPKRHKRDKHQNLSRQDYMRHDEPNVFLESLKNPPGHAHTLAHGCSHVWRLNSIYTFWVTAITEQKLSALQIRQLFCLAFGLFIRVTVAISVICLEAGVEKDNNLNGEYVQK